MLSSALFLSCGRGRYKIKFLFQEPDGLVLIYKRLSVTVTNCLGSSYVSKEKSYFRIFAIVARLAEANLESPDGWCSFTNNLSENAIRLFVVECKNSLYSNSMDRANVSTMIYIIGEMAKAHRLNTYRYFKLLSEHQPQKRMTSEHLGIKNSNLLKILCKLQ